MKPKPKAPADPVAASPAVPPKVCFFRDLAGQDRPRRFLQTSLANGKLPHALIFLGTAGVGKASAALALGQALNCHHRREDQDACGHCPSCRLWAGGNFPDLVIIQPLSEGLNPQIKIEQIRELRRQINFRPFTGAWRLTLIRHAEYLNQASANALLKTLEEPPAGNVLVLTAVSEADVLPTILSRCQRLHFAPLPAGVLTQELLRRRQLTPEQAALLAAVSYGSLGRALSLDWQALAAYRDETVAALAELAQAPVSVCIDWAASMGKKGVELERFILLARLWYRDLLALHCGAQGQQIINRDRLADLNQAQETLSGETLVKRLALLGKVERHVQANFNLELSLDMFGLQWPQSRNTSGIFT